MHQSRPHGREAAHLRLLGTPEFQRGRHPLPLPNSAKGQAIFFYLAVTQRAQSRSTLATLLWGEFNDRAARGNLRKALQDLRDTVDEFVVIERDRVALRPESKLDVDAYWLDGQLTAHHAADLSRLQAMVDCYGGDLLDGFDVGNAPGFEEWLQRERNRLRRGYLRCLGLLATRRQAEGDLDGAKDALARWLAREPWNEEIHVRLMQLLADGGERSAALAQYERCRRALHEELGVEPAPETEALYRRIQVSPVGPPKIPAGHHAAPPMEQSRVYIAGPAITAPAQFYGRSRELARIFGWWRRPPLGNVALVGPRRSGKTSLLQFVSRIHGTPAAELRPGQRQDWLPNAAGLAWIWVDFQDPRMRKLERLLIHLLNGFGADPPARCTLEQFMEAAADHHWQRPTVVLMDELSAGLEAAELTQSFWWALRALTNYAEGNLAFVISAHDSPLRLAQDLGKTSPFFNLFATLPLGPFHQEEAGAFLDDDPTPMTTEERTWILEQSGRWPFLLQILCGERQHDLHSGRDDQEWQRRGLAQIQPYRYLLQAQESP